MEWQNKLTEDLNAARARKRNLKRSIQCQKEKIRSLKRIKAEHRKILSVIRAEISETYRIEESSCTELKIIKREIDL
jgi:hypothetical protein